MKNLENEKWFDINNFEDYQVSNLGRVKSIKSGKEVIKKSRLRKGKLYVSLSSGGFTKMVSVAKLVGINILGFPDNIMIRYIDNDYTNCSSDNLYVKRFDGDSLCKRSSSIRGCGIDLECFWNKRRGGYFLVTSVGSGRQLYKSNVVRNKIKLVSSAEGFVDSFVSAIVRGSSVLIFDNTIVHI